MVTLYPGQSKQCLDYYTEFLKSENIQFYTDCGYLGNLLGFNIKDINSVAAHTCRFILDFHLKEAVISKIYDEYPCFNTEDAGKILFNVSDEISKGPVFDDICCILQEKRTLYPESYVIFNLKAVMIFVYSLTDKICKDMIYLKEKDSLISLLRNYSALSFDRCSKAQVEFSDENICKVYIDEKPPISILNDELLAFLTQKAPDSIKIENPECCPELSEILEDVFTCDKI